MKISLVLNEMNWSPFNKNFKVKSKVYNSMIYSSYLILLHLIIFIKQRIDLFKKNEEHLIESDVLLDFNVRNKFIYNNSRCPYIF